MSHRERYEFIQGPRKVKPFAKDWTLGGRCFGHSGPLGLDLIIGKDQGSGISLGLHPIGLI